METVERRSVPLWQPLFSETEQIKVNIPYKASPFRDELDELRYEVKNVGNGRSMDMIEKLSEDL